MRSPATCTFRRPLRAELADHARWGRVEVLASLSCSRLLGLLYFPPLTRSTRHRWRSSSTTARLHRSPTSSPPPPPRPPPLPRRLALAQARTAPPAFDLLPTVLGPCPSRSSPTRPRTPTRPSSSASSGTPSSRRASSTSRRSRPSSPRGAPRGTPRSPRRASSSRTTSAPRWRGSGWRARGTSGATRRSESR